MLGETAAVNRPVRRRIDGAGVSGIASSLSSSVSLNQRERGVSAPLELSRRRPMSETNPDHFIPHVAIVVSPVNNTLQGFSSVTGTWATLSAVVQDTGATVLTGTNVGV